jgi:RNA polymerase sigma factor (sigma-70 family)
MQLLIDAEHRLIIERIARKQTRDTSVSWEDAAQTAHLKVLQAVKAGRFRQGGSEDFCRWVATVARFEIIDLMRKETHRHIQSLDQNIRGTDLPLLETIADDFNGLDTLEKTDLINHAIAAIKKLDRDYPDRAYLKLWQGHVQGKNQVQIAKELGWTQGTVSRRWHELTGRIAKTLGLLQTADIKEEKRTKSGRKRSDIQW